LRLSSPIVLFNYSDKAVGAEVPAALRTPEYEAAEKRSSSHLVILASLIGASGPVFLDGSLLHSCTLLSQAYFYLSLWPLDCQHYYRSGQKKKNSIN